MSVVARAKTPKSSAASKNRSPSGAKNLPRKTGNLTGKMSGNVLKGGTAAAVMVTLGTFALYDGVVAASAELPILARIVRAIEITVNASLDFGTIALTQEAEAVAMLDPMNGTVRIDGGGGISLAAGVPTAGQVRIRGAAIPVNVSMEADHIRLTNGTTHLTINNFQFNTAHGGSQATITPGGTGNSALISVGATMNARPQQITGTYIGSNTVIANYQ